jgi:hypothetical protein
LTPAQAGVKALFLDSGHASRALPESNIRIPLRCFSPLSTSAGASSILKKTGSDRPFIQILCEKDFGVAIFDPKFEDIGETKFRKRVKIIPLPLPVIMFSAFDSERSADAVMNGGVPASLSDTVILTDDRSKSGKP